MIHPSNSFWRLLSERVDPRVIYLLVAIALTIPLVQDVRLPAAEMPAAGALFDAVEALSTDSGQIVMVAMDWGAGTSAENGPQTKVAIEHLFRRRIPFAVVSLYAQAAPMLKEVPREVAKTLEAEFPGEKWVYGKDWVNLGYQPQSQIFVQSFSSAKDIHELMKTDANGVPLAEIPMMAKVHTIKDVQMLMQFTGLVGVFDVWLQLFQGQGYRPAVVHGCTSITIPDAYLYYASKQIVGFFEGIAGAAWYDKLLNQKAPTRKVEPATKINSGLAFAQIVILVLIVLGNIGHFMTKWTDDPRKPELGGA